MIDRLIESRKDRKDRKDREVICVDFKMSL